MKLWPNDLLDLFRDAQHIVGNLSRDRIQSQFFAIQTMPGDLHCLVRPDTARESYLALGPIWYIWVGLILRRANP